MRRPGKGCKHCEQVEQDAIWRRRRDKLEAQKSETYRNLPDYAKRVLGRLETIPESKED